MKRLTSLATLLILFVCAIAQMPQQLPLMPGVKSGKLDNGLTYYIMHNEQPKDRANFYIAQKVGSALEEEDQLGLAHFLEHMAFNGTTHYPGKNMLNYLQSKGIRFGADINASTNFDQTIYNINNVITTDKPLMDSVLLVIRDWCDGILLEESEIDAERGVINEEWRQRNDASIRMFTSVLPQAFKEYQYQQMPIGKMEVVMNFKPEVLRAYYKKWYRPDQQGIIIVGDFDADEMERKVKELFSTVKMPENAAPREYVEISDNPEPIYIHYEDPEFQVSQIWVQFKSDKTPWEMRNTDAGYIQDELLVSILLQMINDRLEEYAQNPECPYMQAQALVWDYMQIAATKDAFAVLIVPKDDIMSAYTSAMSVVARACKTGFTQSELDRAVNDITSAMEKRNNEKDKTYNASYARQLINNFVENKPAPGTELELMIAQQILPNIPVELYNQVAQQILTPENQVILINQPLNDKTNVLEAAEVIGALENTLNAQYEAYVDEAITDPLISDLPKPGSIKNTSVTDESTTFTLSNGVNVVLKTTDFKADEIRMTAFRKGGKQIYPKDMAANVQMLTDAVECSKVGNFDNTTMRKYLAGKNVSVGFSMSSDFDAVSGTSSVKDFQTMMELVYAYFTALNPDESAYEANVQKTKAALANYDKMPQFIFQKEVLKTLYGDNPVTNQPDAALVDAANYDQMLQMAKNILSNAADYSFIFVGNVDEATLRPMLEQYVASLPSKGKAETTKVINKIEFAKGVIKEKSEIEMQSPVTTVFELYHGDLPFSIENYIMTGLMGDVLDMIYIETLREDEGGTYGASVGADYDLDENIWYLQNQYNTAEDKYVNLDKRADKELRDLLNNGAKADHFNKVREAAVKQYEINSKTNGFWMTKFSNDILGHDTYTGYIEALQNMTLEQFNNFLKGINIDNNDIQMVQIGKPVSK